MKSKYIFPRISRLMNEPQWALTTGFFFSVVPRAVGKRKNTNGTDGLTLRIEWWPVVAAVAAAEEEVVAVVSLFVEWVVGIPAPSRPSFQEEVRASRAAAAWLRWPLPKLVARRLPPPLNMVENMSRMPEIKSQSRSNQYVISIPIKYEKKVGCNTYEWDGEKVLNQIANVKKPKQNKKNGNVRHRRRMGERIKFKTHLTFLSLSEMTEMDPTACVIQYASNITRPPHLFPIATHTHGIPFLPMNLIHHNFWFIYGFLGGFCF